MTAPPRAPTHPPFGQLADVLPVAVYTCDAEGVITYCNDKAVELWGRRPVLGRDSDERFCGSLRLYRPDGSLLPHDQTPMAVALKQGVATRDEEVTIERPDGSRIIVSVNIDPMCDERGAVVGAVNAFQDITDRKAAEEAAVRTDRAQQALGYQRGLTKTITDNTAVGLFMVDVSGRITFLNPAGERITGYRFEDVRGELAHEKVHSVHPDGRPYARSDCPIAQANRAGTSLREHEDTWVRPDGTFYNVVCSIAPLVHDGERIGALIEARDVTAEKLEEARRRFLTDARASLTETLDEQELARKLVEMAVPAIADWASLHTLDEDGSVRRVAAAYGPEHLRPIFEQALPMRPDAKTGPPVVIRSGESVMFSVLPEAALTDTFVDEARESAVRTGLRSAICVPLRSRPGVIAALSLGSMTPGRYTEGDLRLAEDLAEHASIAMENARLYAEARATAERLQAANSAKDEFLGLVSHELKTPITVILGNAKLLARAGAEIDESDRLTALEDVARESDRLHGIIDNLLILARIEQGQQPEPEPIDLRRAVLAAIDDARHAFPGHAIELRQDGGGREFILGEPLFVRQVLWNLLTNAVKYGSREPIEVELTREGHEAQVRVLDRGRGIDPEEAERLFEPFYRSRTAGEDISGVGIGLTVCRRLIEVQGGRVWARPRDGGGADIGFALPLMEE